ncbi:MAG: type I asparaginase [Sandaracinaceae bacterium]|nr:type I asparaginase [Sandaracinaceae bacterium]
MTAAPNRPRVCVLHVGGTIGMVRGDEGFGPKDGFLETYLASMKELERAELPAYTLTLLPPLLDSADMQPDDWVRIARAIVNAYDDFDGFVIVHGTDTLAYTASALSFLLPGLTKPVILTGAQISLAEVRSDGREHLITSIQLAGTSRIPEVCIYFGQRLLRGNRAQKVHNDHFAAFDSGNMPALATVGVGIDVRSELVRAPGSGVPKLVELPSRPLVVALRVFPGLQASMLETVLAGAHGLVLETYGAGNAPTRDTALLDVLSQATARGVVVVNASQCHGGRVRQGLYQTSSSLARAGVVSGHDMTPEAALTKLYCLLASGLSPADVRARMEEDLAGELTRPATH